MACMYSMSMKVFFTASQEGKKEFGRYYEMIYKTIKDLHHLHLNQSLLNEVKTKRKKSNIIELIAEADVCIFECSYSSTTLGFLVAQALILDKPTVILYLDHYYPNLSSIIENEKLIMRNYNKHTLKLVLEDVLTESHHKLDKRFNFFISPDLLNYLQKASRKQKITKSTFLRNLIADQIRKNPH